MRVAEIIEHLCRSRHAARCSRPAAWSAWSPCPAPCAAWDPGCDATRFGRPAHGGPAAYDSLRHHAATAAATAAGFSSTAAAGAPCRNARQPCPATGARSSCRACCSAGTAHAALSSLFFHLCAMQNAVPCYHTCMPLTPQDGGEGLGNRLEDGCLNSIRCPVVPLRSVIFTDWGAFAAAAATSDAARPAHVTSAAATGAAAQCSSDCAAAEHSGDQSDARWPATDRRYPKFHHGPPGTISESLYSWSER